MTNNIIVGTVAYNDPEGFEGLVQNISRCSMISHIIVVDNSEKKIAVQNRRILRKYFPKSRFLYIENITQKRWNKGSARGFYIVIKEFLNNYNNDYLLLMDQDGRIECNSLKEVFKVKSDIYCPTIYDIHTKKPIKEWSRIKQFILGIMFKKTGTPKEPFKTIMCPTNGMLIRREVLEHINYDYKNYFVGLEDFDFCLRVSKKGYNCVVIPSYIVYHPNLVLKHDVIKTQKYILKNLTLSQKLPLPHYFGAIISTYGTEDRVNIIPFSSSVMLAKYSMIYWIVSFLYSSILTMIKRFLFKKEIVLIETFRQYKRGLIQGLRYRKV